MDGKLFQLPSKQLKQRFSAKNLTKKDLDILAEEYYEGVKNKNYKQLGWPKRPYGISKVLINFFARVYSQEKEILEKGIQVYACCPGWCKTDMAGDVAPLDPVVGGPNVGFLVDLPWKIDKELQG